MTLNDTGLKDAFTGNDFRPWHDVVMDQQQMGFNLVANRTYYYKLHYCDPSRNCGLTACLNFTTEDSASSFVFNFNLNQRDSHKLQ